MTPETQVDRLEIAIKNLEFARKYTKSLLDGLTDQQWFWSPSEFDKNAAVTHIAWQVGHLAMAQYGLCLFRQRGRLREDADLMSGKFRKLFMKGTIPQDDASLYPAPAEITAVLDRVYEQVMQEMPTFDDKSLDEPIDPPTAAYATKYGCLLMAANHEMLHAGQIGLLRRMMGLEPVR